MYEPYQALANAIVASAAKEYIKEYRRAIRAGREVGEGKEIREEVKEIRAGEVEAGEKRGRNYEIKRLERFFLSAWYTALTDVDGGWLIEQLRKEARRKDKGLRKEARRKEKGLRKEARRKEKELRKEARRKEKV